METDDEEEGDGEEEEAEDESHETSVFLTYYRGLLLY